MSERELREAADRYREQAHDLFGAGAVVALTEIYDDFGDALADDPDVVKVLRDKLWPMVHVLGTGNAHWAKRVVAQELIHWIERELHIRLIGVHLSNGQLAEPEEVGWEWTGEER